MNSKYVISKISACLALVGTLCLSSCTQSVEPENAATTAVAIPEGIFGNGVNLQPSYYNGGNCDLGWNLMNANTKIKTVRIEVEPGQETNAKRWISEAKANGKTIIVTYHKASVLGSDNTADLTAAANWWKANYASLSANGTIAFTVNLMNEWGSHNITSAAYAAAYNNAISIVRTVYSGNIIIDIPGWGQETATAACAVKGCTTGQTKITDVKIILSAHIYPGAYNQAKGRYMNTSDIDDLASAGRTCILGEFGSVGGSGADWLGITNYAKSKGWTILGWAWAGDGLGMNMISPQFQAYTAGSPKTYTKSSYFNTVYNLL